jgi:hypothetical protein
MIGDLAQGFIFQEVAMQRMLIPAVIALVLIANLGPVAEGKKKVAAGRVVGKVTALAPGRVTVVARGKGGPRKKKAGKLFTFEINQHTRITLPNGKPAPRLDVGMKVRVRFQVVGPTAVATEIKIRGKKK